MSKIIFITGASKGIGAETARLLAPGNEIIIHYNTAEEDAKNVAADVVKLGGKAHIVQSKLDSEESCIRLMEAVSAKVSKIDVLVNNAGSLFERQMCGELTWKLMMETFALNTFSPMMLTSLAMPLLKKSPEACVIFVTTVGIRRGAPSASIYGASKGALDAFMRAIAVELAPAVRVNAVSPGVIVTPFHDKISTPERFEAWREATPLKRNGAPADIAKAIKFIIEDDFLCGETIDVNGGQYMR